MFCLFFLCFFKKIKKLFRDLHLEKGARSNNRPDGQLKFATLISDHWDRFASLCAERVLKYIEHFERVQYTDERNVEHRNYIGNK